MLVDYEPIISATTGQRKITSVNSDVSISYEGTNRTAYICTVRLQFPQLKKRLMRQWRKVSARSIFFWCSKTRPMIMMQIHDYLNVKLSWAHRTNMSKELMYNFLTYYGLLIKILAFSQKGVFNV